MWIKHRAIYIRSYGIKLSLIIISKAQNSTRNKCEMSGQHRIKKERKKQTFSNLLKVFRLNVVI